MDTMVRAPAIGLLFVALICALLVALAASRRGVRRFVLGLLAMLTAVAVAALFVAMAVPTASTSKVGLSYVPATRGGGSASPLVLEAPLTGESGLASPVPLSIEFPASIYPSARAAVRSLAGPVARSAQAVAGGEGPVEIKAYSKDQKRLLLELIEILQRELPGPKVAVHDLGVAEDPPHPEPDTVVLYLWVEPEEGARRRTPIKGLMEGGIEVEGYWPPDAPASALTQEVHVRVMGTDRRVEHAASVVDKLWADDFAAFVARDPRHHWVFARSETAATSPGEAENEALRAASARLEPYVREHLSAGAAAVLARLHRQDAGPWLQWQITKTLHTGLPNRPGMSAARTRLVEDRFIQKFERPYGEIWQASLLVDASPEKMADLGREIGQSLILADRGWRQTLFGVGGVIVLILLVYAFLNVATKGYFTWPLRAATAALLAAVVLFVVFAWV